MENEVVAQGRRGETWLIRRDGNQLTFRGAEGAQFEIGLHETAGRVEWQGLVQDQPYLVALVPKKRVFRMEQTDAFTLLQWLGLPGPEHLQAALSSRFRFTLVAGLVWLVMSLIPGETSAPFAIDPVVAFLGGVLLFEAFLIRLRPVPALFLLDAAWCVCAALLSVYNVFDHSDPIGLGFAFAAWLCMIAWFDVQQHSHFQSVTTNAVGDRLSGQ